MIEVNLTREDIFLYHYAELENLQNGLGFIRLILQFLKILILTSWNTFESSVG